MITQDIHSNQPTIYIAQEQIRSATDISHKLITSIHVLENEINMMKVNLNNKNDIAVKIKLKYDSKTGDLKIYESQKNSHQSNIISLTDELGSSSLKSKEILLSLSKKREYERKLFNDVEVVIKHNKIDSSNLLDTYMRAQFNVSELRRLLAEKTKELHATRLLNQEQLNIIKHQTHIKIQLMINSRINNLSKLYEKITLEQGDYICELLDKLIIQVSPPLNLF